LPRERAEHPHIVDTSHLVKEDIPWERPLAHG
jgi:hypothetical protein